MPPIRFPARALALVAGLLAAGFTHAMQFVVTTPADSGPGSLRAAIGMANTTAGIPDSITFAIDPMVHGHGPWTIALRQPLPPIADRVIVSGYSQPGSAPGFPARPMIDIDVSGMTCRPDRDFGSPLTVIRGGERSLIAGLNVFGEATADCRGAGILVLADGVQLVSNRIGLRADGSVAGLHGLSAGIGVLMSRGVIVGGPGSDEGNVFAGIDTRALVIDGEQHTVRNNWFGSNGMGEVAVGSMIGKAGLLTGAIVLYPPRAYASLYSLAIQTASFGLRDSHITGNHFVAVDYDGIYLMGGGPQGPDSHGNHVTGNRFGTNVWGLPGAGTGTAIRLAKAIRDTEIADNLISNSNSGIVLHPRNREPEQAPAGAGNRISRNRFTDLDAPAIELADAVPLANDALDADEGANRLQNRPVLRLANTAGLLEGDLHSMPGRSYTIELFLSAACGHAGGNVADLFLQSFSVTTDGHGDAAFSRVLPQPAFDHFQVGDVLTATATDADGNTSELSDCVGVAATLPVTLRMPTYPARVPAMDQTLGVSVTIAGNGPLPPSGSVVFSVIDPLGRRRELGRATIANGQASLPPPPQGVLPQAGRYRIEARYDGDARYAANAQLSADVVVFRPASALLQPERSAPVRHDPGSGVWEWLDPGSPQSLSVDWADSYIDADRFDGRATDQMLFSKGGEYFLVDAQGRAQRRTSGVLGSREIVDLIQVDDDVLADALVRDPASGEYAIVRRLFQREQGETLRPLGISAELQWRGSGDIDGDGHTDLVFQVPGSNQASIVLMRDGAAVATVRVAMPDLPLRQVTTADVDGDGFDDLLWSDPATTKIEVERFERGHAAGHLEGDLGTAGWSLPGPVHAAKPGDNDYGMVELLLDDGVGNPSLWTGLRMGSSSVYGTLEVLPYGGGYELERSR